MNQRQNFWSYVRRVKKCLSQWVKISVVKKKRNCLANTSATLLKFPGFTFPTADNTQHRQTKSNSWRQNLLSIHWISGGWVKLFAISISQRFCLIIPTPMTKSKSNPRSSRREWPWSRGYPCSWGPARISCVRRRIRAPKPSSSKCL